MHQRSILLLGCLISSGTIALGSPAIAQSAPPVVRANGFTKQVPSCYIETTGGGFQNLDANCLMGKVPDAGTIDMVTDRDKDGVPDALVTFFAQMDQFESLAGATPEARQAKIAQMQKAMNDFAQRSPLSPALKADFKTMIGTLSDLAALTPGRLGSAPSERQLAQINAKAAALDKAMQRLNKDPFMQKVNEYSSRYQMNKYEGIRAKSAAQ